MEWLGLLLSCGIGAIVGWGMPRFVETLFSLCETSPQEQTHASRGMSGMIFVSALLWSIAWILTGATGSGALAWGGLVLWWTWLLFLAAFDARHQILPVEPLLVVGVLGFLARWLIGGANPWSLLLGGLVGLLFFGAQSWLSRGRLMGAGDPLLALMIGLVLGWPLMATVLYFTYMAVIPLLLFQLLRVGTIRRVRWPFAPLLVTGAILASLFGEQLLTFVVHLF